LHWTGVGGTKVNKYQEISLVCGYVSITRVSFIAFGHAMHLQS
jgi:hypothetical protein